MVDWKTVAGDGYPPCDGHTAFIGINSAGYACCFNAMQGGTCVMETPEGAYRQMSDLRDWRLLDRPIRGAPVDADARDAARYRWLRSDDIEWQDGMPYVAQDMPGRNCPITLTESDLDAVVDKAMTLAPLHSSAAAGVLGTPPGIDKAMELADAYVVAASGDTATARHKYSTARAELRSYLERALGVRGTPTMPDEIDLNGRTDVKHEGIEYLGTAKRQADGKYHVLANVHGALCTVEVSITARGVERRAGVGGQDPMVSGAPARPEVASQPLPSAGDSLPLDCACIGGSPVAVAGVPVTPKNETKGGA